MVLATPLEIPISLLLGLGFVWSSFQALQRTTATHRINHIAHALMDLVMLGMVWHWIELPLLPLVFLFGMASFWFFLQVVAHPRVKFSCRSGAERVRCGYHAAASVSMILMLVMMALPADRATTSIAMDSHHHGAIADESAAEMTQSAAGAMMFEEAALPLAVAFAAAALLWATTALRRVHPQSEMVSTSSGMIRVVASRARFVAVTTRTHQSTSALSMALMFGTMSLS